MKEKTNNLSAVKWDWEIKPKTSWWNISLIELYSYKDLIIQLVRKDFLGQYQQTLLGPFWALLQPLLSVIVYVIVFNNVIGISTGNVPPFLFNLIGLTLWNLFSEIFLQTSKTFSQNGDIFNKVYFPRIIVAISSLMLQLQLFSVNILLLLVTYIFCIITGTVDFNLGQLILIFPIILITAGIGFGGGLIFSVLTAKYRDLMSLMQLLIRLLMFVCPLFYTLSMVPERVKWLVIVNPLSSLFEYFRFAFIGTGTLDPLLLSYSVGFMVIIVCFGVMLFNKMSDKLIDIL
jgi:lipopolysaccharide transport system permease protein